METTFTPGQRVKDVFGKTRIVVIQIDCQVFFECGGWMHPSKVFPA